MGGIANQHHCTPSGVPPTCPVGEHVKLVCEFNLALAAAGERDGSLEPYTHSADQQCCQLIPANCAWDSMHTVSSSKLNRLLHMQPHLTSGAVEA